MTKKANKIFFILATIVVFIWVAVPVIDYFISKAKVLDKGQFTTLQEYQQYVDYMTTYVSLDEPYWEFYNRNYTSGIQMKGVLMNAIMEMQSNYPELFGWEYKNYNLAIVWSVCDIILILFLMYCIFVIPISMVDLFYKMMKREVD